MRRGLRMKLSRRGAWIGLAALIASVAPAVASNTSSPAPRERGCDLSPSRSAVAFDASGRVVRSPIRLVPCSTRTGFGAVEGHIRVAPNGTIVAWPAIDSTGLNAQAPQFLLAGFAVSRDRGRTWKLVKPGGTTFQPNDDSIHIDRATGRLYLQVPSNKVPVIGDVGTVDQYDLLSSPASSAGYVNWSRQTLITHGFMTENSRFTSAPARAGVPKPRAGERIGYWCGNAVPAATPADLRNCWRTLDGGTNWEQLAILASSPVPQHPECNGQAETMTPGDGNYPQGASDGSLWVTVQCRGLLFLARSTDGGMSWPILHRRDGTPVTIPVTVGFVSGGLVSAGSSGVSFGTPELRVDPAGNLYVVEQVGSSLLVRISRDGGLTWGRPLNVTAPAVRARGVQNWQVALGYRPGELAVAYLTPHEDGGVTATDGYISLTRNLLSANPIVHAAQINRPGPPLASSAGVGYDYIDVDIAPDGTPWAYFFSDCPPQNSGDAYCAAVAGRPGRGNPGPQSTTIGHLSRL